MRNLGESRGTRAHGVGQSLQTSWRRLGCVSGVECFDGCAATLSHHRNFPILRRHVCRLGKPAKQLLIPRWHAAGCIFAAQHISIRFKLSTTLLFSHPSTLLLPPPFHLFFSPRRRHCRRLTTGMLPPTKSSSAHPCDPS